MTLSDIETRIYNYYQWFHANAPGVQVQEEGTLARLWALQDQQVEDLRDTLTAEEFRQEYGRGAYAVD